MDAVREQLQKLNNEIDDLAGKAEATWTAYMSATNPQQKAELKERHEKLEKKEELLNARRVKLEDKLPSSGAETQAEIPEGLQRFAAAAWGSPQEVVDGWMQAPIGTCFLGKPVLGSTLYVREAYIALEEKLEELRKVGTAHVVISGNPGLGKSWFALYMLVRWLGGKLPVLWHWPRRLYLFEENTVRRLSTDEAVKVLESYAVPGLRYIVDGTSPLVPDPSVEQSLVAHSPDVSKYKEYLKPPGHSASPLWMPCWEPHELEALRAKVFSQKVTHAEMLQLIGRRGPVPRLVLDYAHEDGADAEIREAIGALMASDIKAARPSTAQASHRLVLIHPPGWRQGDFINHVLTFLSTDIQLQVIQKLEDDMSYDMAALLQLTQSSHSQLAAAVGAYFPEGQVHCTLRKGGSYEMRICPKKKFSGPVDETLLGPAQAADSSSSEASATDSSSPQAPAGNSKADSFATPDSPEAGADSSDTALRPGGGGTAGSKWDFTLPALPVQYISRVEDLRDVPTGDMYVQPPMNFAAIDSIAILGGTAYLMQITQDIKHDLNVGLLSVLACLPAHLEVRFVWALPAQVWASKTFNSRDVPQIDDLSPPAPTSRARTKKRTGTAEGSLSAASESADDGTAAEMRMSGVGKQAIKKLVDRDVALVETRLAACEMQFKMAVHVICSAPRNPPQTPTQGRPQASLSTTSSMSKSAASAVLMSRLGCKSSGSGQRGRCQGLRCLLQRPPLAIARCGALS